ncbi:MAG: hypothetical protein RR922_05370 [Clostridia bacterium]
MKKGMSLIVLVITILVMIILAGVVVVSLSKNNPIETAKTANTLTALSEAQSAVTLYAANKLAGAADGSTTLKIGAEGADKTELLTATAVPLYANGSSTAIGPNDTVDDKNNYYKISNSGAKDMEISLPASSGLYYASNIYGKIALVVKTQDEAVKYNNPSVLCLVAK